jgi:hypothetical protein
VTDKTEKDIRGSETEISQNPKFRERKSELPLTKKLAQPLNSHDVTRLFCLPRILTKHKRNLNTHRSCNYPESLWEDEVGEVHSEFPAPDRDPLHLAHLK